MLRRLGSLTLMAAVLLAPFVLNAGTASAQELAACADVTVEVSPPTADAPTTVSVVLTPEVNLAPATEGALDSFHLHYFVDTEATPAGQTVPTGQADIIHSAATTQDLGELPPGEHNVTVVLGQVNHTACEARGSVTFTVAQTTDPTPTPTATPATDGAPGPATTGNAGLMAEGTSTMAFAILGLVAAALLAGARMVSVRHR